MYACMYVCMRECMYVLSMCVCLSTYLCPRARARVYGCTAKACIHCCRWSDMSALTIGPLVPLYKYGSERLFCVDVLNVTKFGSGLFVLLCRFHGLLPFSDSNVKLQLNLQCLH